MVLVGLVSGYGFVDYDSAQAAEAAVKALQASGVQAQMAKVSPCPPPASAKY